MKKGQSGFTLVEIMIVVVIIGVLSVVAIRSFNAYATRAKVAEAMNIMTTCRTVIAEVYMSGDSIPAAGTWGCETSATSKYVDSVDTSGEGIIKVNLRGFNDLRLDFHTITMAPLDTSGNLMSDLGRVARWRCGSVGDGTDVNLDVLPGTCRGN